MARTKKWIITFTTIIFVVIPLLGFLYYKISRPWIDCVPDERHARDYIINSCSTAIKITPRFARLYNWRGQQYSMTQQYALAVQDYDKAIQLNLENSFIYTMRGFAYLHLGKYDLAKQDFQTALQKYDPAIKNFEPVMKNDSSDPLNVGAYCMRGLASLTLGYYKAAEQDFKTALINISKVARSEKYRSGLLLLLHDAHFSEGDFSSALNDSEQLFQIDPTDTNVIIWRHIDSSHAGQDDHEEFQNAITDAKPDAWNSYVLDFFAGKMSSDDLLQYSVNADQEVQKKQMCVANFYIGESLMTSDAAKAKAYFKTANQVCTADFYQVNSETELKRIDPE